jgi:hypothetical protein
MACVHCGCDVHKADCFGPPGVCRGGHSYHRSCFERTVESRHRCAKCPADYPICTFGDFRPVLSEFRPVKKVRISQRLGGKKQIQRLELLSSVYSLLV